MIQIEFLCGRNQVWGKFLFCELCAIGTDKKKKRKKRKEKVEKMTKVLFVEVRVQNNEFGPKELSKFSPCVFKLNSTI